MSVSLSLCVMCMYMIISILVCYRCTLLPPSQQLTGEDATPDHASLLLDRYFSSADNDKLPTVLLAYELDLLWTRKQTVLYNLFDWPTRQHAKLIVLAVANTMDLPEKVMMNKVASRLVSTYNISNGI